MIYGGLAGAVAVLAPKAKAPKPAWCAPLGQPAPAASGGPTLLADSCMGGSDLSQAISGAGAGAGAGADTGGPELVGAFAATYERWWAELPHKGAVAPAGLKIRTSDLAAGYRPTS